MCCVLQYTLYGKTVKGKTNHKRQNCTSCQTLSVTPADTVMLCKKIDFVFEKLVRENKCKQKHCITCLFTLMQTAKKMIFHFCACIVRLQVLICYVNTCLQRIISRFCSKVRNRVLFLILAMY